MTVTVSDGTVSETGLLSFNEVLDMSDVPEPIGEDVLVGINNTDDGSVLTGVGEPDAVIQLFDSNGNALRDENGNPITTIVDEDGNWRITGIHPPIQDFDHVTAVITDRDGNISRTTDEIRVRGGDYTVPDRVTSSGADEYGTLIGTAEPGTQVTVYDATGHPIYDSLGAQLTVRVAADGTWSIDGQSSAISVGDQVMIVVMDVAGNATSTLSTVGKIANDVTDPSEPADPQEPTETEEQPTSTPISVESRIVIVKAANDIASLSGTRDVSGGTIVVDTVNAIDDLGGVANKAPLAEIRQSQSDVNAKVEQSLTVDRSIPVEQIQLDRDISISNALSVDFDEMDYTNDGREPENGIVMTAKRDGQFINFDIDQRSNVASKQVEEYIVTMRDGSPLPAWMEHVRGGKIIGFVPAEVDNVELKITARLSDGSRVEQLVSFDPNTTQLVPLEQVGVSDRGDDQQEQAPRSGPL